MAKVYSKAIDVLFEFEREIGKLNQGWPGPTLVFIAGMHGNEPSGLLALQQVFRELSNPNFIIHGSVIGLSGNITALQSGVRFVNKDFNRVWLQEGESDHGKPPIPEPEASEKEELLGRLRQIQAKAKGPLYFFDLHTTSSPTNPFITIND
ncbi:MAG: aspartoacylase, partial [Flavobacteriales bacterium]|nr:aspartoacylase [Flavobacteriales bacterium]